MSYKEHSAIHVAPHRRFALRTCMLAASVCAGAGLTAEADEKEFLSRVRRVTLDGRRAGEGYFSADGEHLVFQSERDQANPFFQIFTLDLTTGDLRRVSPGYGKTTCAFFQPGTDRLLYASTHLDPEARQKQAVKLAERKTGTSSRYDWDYDAHFDVFSSLRDGSDAQRLTNAPGYDAEAGYSPDGRHIVFCSFRDQPTGAALTAADRDHLKQDPAYFGEIYIMNADGSGARRLTDWPGYDGGPFFSPDGERIVWRHFEPGGALADIYTMKLDGSDRRRVTEFGCMSWAPYYHPSGEYIIFASNKLGFSNFELFIVDAAGTRNPVRVTTTEGFDGLAVFHPDGRQLCWTSTRHDPGARKAGQLYMADWNHDAARAALAAAPARTGASATPGTELGAYADRQRGVTELDAFAARQRHVKAARDQQTTSPVITEADLRAHVRYLADDALEGRLTGSAGIQAAAAYITQAFQQAGLQPGGQDGSYEQPFTYLSGVDLADDGNSLRIVGGQRFEATKDLLPLALSQNGNFTGEIVFAGYGIVGEEYDSYDGLDVTDKCVIALRYFPEDVSTERKSTLSRYAGLRIKAMHARERGAKALLIVSGPRSPHAGELIPMTADGAAGDSGILAATITLDVAEKLLASAKVDLDAVQQALDQEDPHTPTTFSVPDAQVVFSVNLKQEERSCRNVIGILPGQDTDGLADDYLVIGAHYDHLGHGETGNAFDYDPNAPKIYNGADDNASGVAAVLELAARLIDMQMGSSTLPKTRRGIIFACWSGEEIGLIGSENFIKHPPVPLEQIKAYVNFDMVGRLTDNKLSTQGIGSSPEWKQLLERRNIPAGFDLSLQEDPYLPTDSTSFYRAGIPVLAFFTGSHEDYHRPTDDIERVNFEGLTRVTRFAEAVIRDLRARETPLTYAKVERSSKRSMRGGMRAYTGTEPDYTTTGDDGMRLKGVIPGGPAEKAGLRSGDVIIEIAGLPIKNVYEYTHALGILKPEEEVKVVVMRDGKRTELKLIPGTR